LQRNAYDLAYQSNQVDHAPEDISTLENHQANSIVNQIMDKTTIDLQNDSTIHGIIPVK